MQTRQIYIAAPYIALSVLKLYKVTLINFYSSYIIISKLLKIADKLVFNYINKATL